MTWTCNKGIQKSSSGPVGKQEEIVRGFISITRYFWMLFSGLETSARFQKMSSKCRRIGRGEVLSGSCEERSVRKALVIPFNVSEKQGQQQLFSNWFPFLSLLCTVKLKGNFQLNSYSWIE